MGEAGRWARREGPATGTINSRVSGEGRGGPHPTIENVVFNQVQCARIKSHDEKVDDLTPHNLLTEEAETMPFSPSRKYNPQSLDEFNEHASADANLHHNEQHENGYDPNRPEYSTLVLRSSPPKKTAVPVP